LTFIATASAVEQCGFQPYPVDVDPTTWMLDPAALRSHPMLDQVGVVVPVAPFGRPVPQTPWVAFREGTGIPVVIDGAASFDRLTDTPGSLTGGIPIALSFHATKAFSTGEGGGVACSEVDLIPAVVQALNFGFRGTRESRAPNINGKMSEFHAAVGLAEFDGWAGKLGALVHVTEQYRIRLTQAALGERLIAVPDVGASYVLFQCTDRREVDEKEHALDRKGISHRRWYGTGLLEHSHLAHLPHDELLVSESLASRLLGLPLAPDLSESAIGRVVVALQDAG
jgi:dTDP-4-amino-4,6-dideoxygalactose transaminase